MSWENNTNENKTTTMDASPITGGRAVIDEGLRAHMVSVYKTMGNGLIITALVSYLVAAIPALSNAIFGNQIVFLIAAFSPLLFLWLGFSPARLAKSSAGKIRTMFYLFASLFAVSLGSIFLVYTGESIVRVFFITSAMFLGMSLWGYTTKKDLSSMGSFLMMGLWGIIIASVINIFMQSAMVHWVTSIIAVVIFTGMTAWDTQRIKEMYSLSHGEENNAKMATMGALSLYLNFVLLFQNLLQIMGNRN